MRQAMTPLFTPSNTTAQGNLGSPLLCSLCCANLPEEGEPSPYPKSGGPTEVTESGDTSPTSSLPGFPVLSPQNYGRLPADRGPLTIHPGRALSHPLPACCRFFLPTAAPMMLNSSSSDAPDRR